MFETTEYLAARRIKTMFYKINDLSSDGTGVRILRINKKVLKARKQIGGYLIYPSKVINLP